MKQIAHTLLKIKAVMINNQERFTWASGIKSPIYTDNRLITSFVNEREFIENEFAKLVISNFPEVECVMGTATAGISHAAYISQVLRLPMGYVRGSSKSHGKKNSIEGKVYPGMKVVVIEDLFSTGGSSMTAIDILKEHGCEVLGVVSIFSYQLPILKETFKNIKHKSLTNLDELLEVAAEHKYISTEEISIVKEFRNSLGRK